MILPVNLKKINRFFVQVILLILKLLQLVCYLFSNPFRTFYQHL